MTERNLVAGPLTVEGFAPFGRIVTGSGSGRPVNAGTAERLELHGHFGHATAAGLPTLAIYRCLAQPAPVLVQLLERHPLTSQTFVPLRVAAWLIVVAPSGVDGDPLIAGARAFLAGREQGITYAPGVWHSPLIALEEPAELTMLMWEAGSAADCEIFPLPEPIRVRPQPRQGGDAAMLRWSLAIVVALASAPAAATERVALLPFELVNTSLEPTRPDEAARLDSLNGIAGQRLVDAGYAMVDPAPVADRLGAIASLRGCNGCELALGRELGADYVAVGWVQKVSNLILNINLAVRSVATGRTVAAGTVDIRGNTDESWRRGVLYLLEHRILPPG